MKISSYFSCSKWLLLAASLFLAACDNSTTVPSAEDEMEAVTKAFDDESGVVNGLEDTYVGPDSSVPLTEAQITEAQEGVDSVDAPESIL